MINEYVVQLLSQLSKRVSVCRIIREFYELFRDERKVCASFNKKKEILGLQRIFFTLNICC